jgi:hypothetical protein
MGSEKLNNYIKKIIYSLRYEHKNSTDLNILLAELRLT